MPVKRKAKAAAVGIKAGGAKEAAEPEVSLAALKRSGLEAGTVSVGGTPDMYHAHELKVSTEHRPGTYIYSDRAIARAGVGTLDIAFHWGVTSYEQQLRSMTLFAEHVIPETRGW